MTPFEADTTPPVITPPAFIGRVVATVLGVVGASVLRADPDLWGHLRFGLDIVRDRKLTVIDPYSFTSDVPWINHEWLSETSMAVAYLAGHLPGLLLLKMAIVGTAYAVMAFRLRRVETPARWWFLAIGVAATMTITSTMRPQLWTVLALTIIASTAHWRLSAQLLLWPAVFALLANLHGGWIVGLGVIGAWSLGTIRDRRDWRAAVPLGALCSACLFATLLTPYGMDLWRFVWRTVGFGREIVEWRPVWEVHVLVLCIWLAVAVAAVVAVRHTPWSWATTLPVLLLGISSLKVIRLIGLFGILVAVLLGTRWRYRTEPRLRPALQVSVMLVAILPAAFIVRTQTQCLPVDGPDLAAAAALATAAPGRLMVPFNWGQYAIWHFGPQLQVSMDGRRETVYSQRMIDLQLALDRGQPEIVSFIATERPEYIWTYLSSAEPLAGTLRSIGYRQDVVTERSTVWVRSDLPTLTRGSAMLACFP